MRLWLIVFIILWFPLIRNQFQLITISFTFLSNIRFLFRSHLHHPQHSSLWSVASAASALLLLSLNFTIFILQTCPSPFGSLILERSSCPISFPCLRIPPYFLPPPSPPLYPNLPLLLPYIQFPLLARAWTGITPMGRAQTRLKNKSKYKHIHMCQCACVFIHQYTYLPYLVIQWRHSACMNVCMHTIRPYIYIYLCMCIHICNVHNL